MPSQLPEYSDSVRAAVADYWQARRSRRPSTAGVFSSWPPTQRLTGRLESSRDNLQTGCL